MTPSASPAYVRAATACATLRVSTAQEGTRNRTLRDEAYSLGQLVGADALDEEEAAQTLLRAAEACGLREREAASVIRRALRDGAKDPRRVVPERSAPSPRSAPTPREPRAFPPADDVARLWSACRPVGDDPIVSAYLVGRGLDPDAVTLEHLAGAVPQDAELPSWAWGPDGPWTSTGHRLLVPLYGASGGLASVRARTVVANSEPKSLAPSGYAVRGAVMADLVGGSLLRGEPVEAWNKAVVVVEGEPDFLTWGTNRSDAADEVPAVFGIESGAWTEAIAARITDGASVVIRTHHDPAGNQYAQVVARSLGTRCRVFRSRPPEAS
jgi:hypothetical protein